MTEAAPQIFPPGDELRGRRILLTGASGSIGRVTALRLAAAGARLVLHGRDPTRLEQVAANLPAGTDAIIAPYDLMEAEGIPAWVKGLAEQGGAFAGIAHTAASQVMRPMRIMNMAFIMQTFTANVTSCIMLGKALRQKNCRDENAALALMSSTAEQIGGAGNVAYAASKGAVIAASRAMAHEFIKEKIRVNCVVASLIESDMSERAREATLPESWDSLLAGYPLGLGKPSDIAEALLYLVSDRSRWMTGTEFRVDGGLTVM